jgi:uncharacterized membrane protein
MKKDFITGLVILLPVAVTFFVLGFLIDLFTDPFLNFTEGVLHHYRLLDKPFFIFSADQVLLFWSRLFILLFLAALTLLTGFITHLFFLDYLFTQSSKFINRIPIINRIYRTAQDGVNALFNRDKDSHTKVVLVPYPHQKAYCIGMMPHQSLNPDSDASYLDKVSVFVPGAPNPSMGFMLIYQRDQVKILDMTVEEALKFIVSCGAMKTNFKS